MDGWMKRLEEERGKEECVVYLLGRRFPGFGIWGPRTRDDAGFDGWR